MKKLINLGEPHSLDANGNPKPGALREVANVFEELHREGVELDMNAPDWSVEDPCGTPVCHAGAFALASGCEFRDGKFDFSEAVDLLAGHLGFSGDGEDKAHDAYCKWAAYNPRLWGNFYGNDMFAYSCAFVGSADLPTLAMAEVDLNLNSLADHYRRMADRIEALPA